MLALVAAFLIRFRSQTSRGEPGLDLIIERGSIISGVRRERRRDVYLAADAAGQRADAHQPRSQQRYPL